MNTLQKDSRRGLLLVWAVVATLIGLISTALLAVTHFRAATVSPFVSLPEPAVPGRYTLTEGGEVRGVMTLLPDHTFIPPDGRKLQSHRWEIGRDSLLIIWASGIEHLRDIESPGVYVGSKPDGTPVRMEKAP